MQIAAMPVGESRFSTGRKFATVLAKLGACSITTKFLDNKISISKILFLVAFSKKNSVLGRLPKTNSVLGRFSSLPPIAPLPPSETHFYSIVVPRSLKSMGNPQNMRKDRV